MSHFLPVDEIQSDLQNAVDEFFIASQEIRKEEDVLEKQLLQTLEQKKIEAIRKTLGTL